MTIVPNTNMPVVTKENSASIKQVMITHADGTKEMVYVHDDAPLVRKLSFIDRLQIVSLAVGIIGTGLLAYVTYLNLKKMNS